MSTGVRLTTAAGAPVVDNQNVQTAGPRGPMLLQDVVPRARPLRSRSDPRAPHACEGSAAYGTFTVTHDITPTPGRRSSPRSARRPICSCASPPSPVSAADAERDIRGFSMRFYTEQGNWDLVGNNTPVFYLRDPLVPRSQPRGEA